jgi:hypothetical protein
MNTWDLVSDVSKLDFSILQWQEWKVFFWEVTRCSLVEFHWHFRGFSVNFCQSTQC